MKKTKAFLIGRNALTGELVPVEKARKYPAKFVVERMPKRGYGDSK